MGSDAQIVREVLRVDRQAFEALVLRYGRMAYAVAYARLGSHQDAEDAVQEGWVQAFLQLDRLREPDKFPGWLASIVRNISLNATRNLWRRQPLETTATGAAVDSRSSLEETDVQRALWAHVQTLTPEFREVLTLHYQAGMSTEAIADCIGLPRETVKKRLQRARAALAEQPLHTLFEPADREEKRRKRVMSLILLLPAQQRHSPASPTGTKRPRSPWPLMPKDHAGVKRLLALLVLLLFTATFATFLIFSRNRSQATPPIISQPPPAPVPAQPYAPKGAAPGEATKGSPSKPAPYSKG